MPNAETTAGNAYFSLAAFPHKRVRMVRPGYLGITISAQGPEHVMPISEANDLVGMINRAKHDGESNAA